MYSITYAPEAQEGLAKLILVVTFFPVTHGYNNFRIIGIVAFTRCIVAYLAARKSHNHCYK